MSRPYLWFRANKAGAISLSLLHIEPQWSRQFNSTFFLLFVLFFFFQWNDQFDPQMWPRQFNTTCFSFCLVFLLQIANLIHNSTFFIFFLSCFLLPMTNLLTLTSAVILWFELFDRFALLSQLQLQRKLVFFFFALHWKLYVGWCLKMGGKLNTS